jgi:ribulose 1,5-bisphosphate carboxylase large subunit-like protein
MGVANASEPTHQKKVSKKITALNDNETDAEYVPSLTKLEYEIDDFGTSLQQTMGSLAGKQAPKRRINKIRDINDL